MGWVGGTDEMRRTYLSQRSMLSNWSCVTPKFSIKGILRPRRSSSRSLTGLMKARACCVGLGGMVGGLEGHD